MNDKSWVTACIPTYRCTQYLRQAVISLLHQTHNRLRVIVINDGDMNAPWSVLADIRDPRLVRFDLPQNRGPYFALAVALEATPDPYFLVQDADDWSASHRVATLLQMLARDRSNYAFSTLAQFHDNCSGGFGLDNPMFHYPPKVTLNFELKNRIPHHGLFCAASLRRLGGYFAGFRFGYDMLLTNLLLMVGTVSWTPDKLYWRRRRPDSLTQAQETGLRSVERMLIHSKMTEFYQETYSDYQRFVSGRISGQYLLRLIRWRVHTACGAENERYIRHYARCLRTAMIMHTQWRG